MCMYAHGSQPTPYLYEDCMFMTPFITCLIVFLHSHHIRLHAHGTGPTPYFYVAYILTALRIACSIFSFFS